MGCISQQNFKNDSIMALIQLLKSSMRSSNLCLTYTCTTQLFNLLDLYAVAKSPTSAIIYKILVFFFIEKHDHH
jgi:hypothetical protein